MTGRVTSFHQLPKTHFQPSSPPKHLTDVDCVHACHVWLVFLSSRSLTFSPPVSSLYIAAGCQILRFSGLGSTAGTPPSCRVVAHAARARLHTRRQLFSSLFFAFFFEGVFLPLLFFRPPSPLTPRSVQPTYSVTHDTSLSIRLHRVSV